MIDHSARPAAAVARAAAGTAPHAAGVVTAADAQAATSRTGATGGNTTGGNTTGGNTTGGNTTGANATGANAITTATPSDRAAVHGALGWGALLVWQLLLSRAVLRGVGEQAWGVWATIGAVKAFVVFLDGGLAQGIVRDAGQGERDSGAGVRIRAAWRLGVLAAAAALGVALVAAPWVGSWLALAPAVAAIAPVLVVVHGLDAAVSLATGPFAALLRGRGQFGVLALANVAQAGLGAALLLLLVPVAGAPGAAIAVVGARAIVAAGQAWWLRHRGLLPARGEAALVRAALRPVLQTVLPIWVIVAANQLAMRADVPIVGRTFGAGAAGHYELGQLLPTAAMSLLVAILTFALPRFVADIASGDAAALCRRVPRVVFMACLLAGLGFGTLALLADDLLLAWVGQAPPLAVAVARIYAAAWACNAAVHVLVQAAIAQGRFAMLTWPTVIGSLANFALSVGLAWSGDPLGPAWATLLLMTVWDLAVVPTILVRSLQLPALTVLRGAAMGLGGGAVLALCIARGTAAVVAAPLARVGTALVAVAVVAAVALDLAVRRRSSLRGLFVR